MFAAVLGSKVLEGVTEIDKVLLHLEVKEFTVEASTLITVQHLIQWTTNFVLKMLSNLPEWRNSPRGSVVSLIGASPTLNNLNATNRFCQLSSAICCAITNS